MSPAIGFFISALSSRQACGKHGRALLWIDSLVNGSQFRESVLAA